MILLLLAALWLPGCSVEELEHNNGNPLPEGVTRLSVAIASGVQTKAVGDKLADATDNEKRIDRMAFVVYTEAEGMQVYPPLKTGEQAGDFPNKVALTDNGNGTYSATVDLTAGAGHEADIVALANLPEDYDYNQILTWKGLLDSVSVSTQVMPTVTDAGGGKAFIMQGNTTVTLHKEKEEKFDLSMERLVARIDITNMAYSGEAGKGFVLTGARILRAMPVSYLYPHDFYTSPDTATVTHESWSFDDTAVKYYMGEVEDANDKTAEVTGGDPAAADRQGVWHNLYTYENSDTEHAPTAIEISGTFRGNPITRQIPFEVLQADGITRKAVPLVRNHRYLLLIKPAPSLTDIAYDIKVDEWNAVDTINVQPNQDQLPVFTAYECTQATQTFGITADKLIPDTIVIPATGGTITFTASCPFDTRVTFGYASADDGSNWLSATSTDPTPVPATKASTDLTYQREYTVTVKNNTLDASFVNRGYIYIANGGNGSVVDTVTVFQGANIAYGNTRFSSITKDGIVWAPVNVGQTAIPTAGQITKTGMSTEDIVKYCGYYYQWGRNVPFSYNGNPGDVAPNGTFPTYLEGIADNYTYADKFIIGSTDYSWFSDYKGTLSPALTVGDNAWPRDQQPCPAGWRIPTKAELDKILADNPKQTDGKYIVPNTDGKFVLPATGFRDFTNGASSSLAFSGNYWSSALNASGMSPKLNINSSAANTNDINLAFGISVRCVKE